MHHEVTAKAPGKIILTGEHAVLYGAPALICAINRHVTVHCQTSPTQQEAICNIILPNTHYSFTPKAMQS